jgi:hypothetical protein
MPTGIYESKNRKGGQKGKSGVYKRIKGINYLASQGFQKGSKAALGKHWQWSEQKRIKNYYSKDQIYSINWTDTLKKAIRERDHYVCQLCLKNGWVVHHIDYDKKNCDPKNLITLCRKCHAKTNYNRNIWIRVFNN